MQNTMADARTRYRERLTPGLWMLVTIAVAGPMVALVFLRVTPAYALLIGVAATLILVAAAVLLSPVIEVRDGVLYAGRAHIDVRWLADPEARTGEEATHARGPGLPGDGWHLIRGGIDGIVVVALTDPDDPHGTWTVSSRTPERLVAAIRAADAERAPI